LLTVAAVVAIAAVINSIMPAINRAGQALVTSADVADDRLNSRIEIIHATGHVAGVEDVTDVRARWIGHRLHAEVNVTVAGGLSVADGHEVAKAIRHRLLHDLAHLGGVTVHVDPDGQGG